MSAYDPSCAFRLIGQERSGTSAIPNSSSVSQSCQHLFPSDFRNFDKFQEFLDEFPGVRSDEIEQIGKAMPRDHQFSGVSLAPSHQGGGGFEELVTSQGHIQQHIRVEERFHSRECLAFRAVCRASPGVVGVTENCPDQRSANARERRGRDAKASRRRLSSNPDTLVPRLWATCRACAASWASIVTVKRSFMRILC